MNFSGLNLTFSVDPSTIAYLETSRGVAFTASLLLDGKKIGLVENRGNGGATTGDLDNPQLTRTLLRSTIERLDTTEESFFEGLMDVAEGVT